MAGSPTTNRFTHWLNMSMASRRLSQADLARAVGVGDAQVSRWRRGQVTPTVYSLQRLADTFGVPRAILDTLVGYPSGEQAVSAAPDDPARQAEIAAYQSWFGEQLAEQVPQELWQVYVDGCAALAQALGASFRETLAAAAAVELPAANHGKHHPIGFRQ